MSILKSVITAVLIFFVTTFAEELFFIDRGDTIFLTAPKFAPRANGVSIETDGWLTTQKGNRVKISDGIIVELKNAQAAGKIFSISAVKSYEQLSDNIFLVIPADKNNQFGLSREFLKNELVINSHPNLIRERQKR